MYSGFVCLNSTVDGHQEYKKGNRKYVEVECIDCGELQLKRKDVYKKQLRCKSCASKENSNRESFKQAVSNKLSTHGMSNSLTWNSWFQMRRRVRQGVGHHLTYQGMYIDPTWDSFEKFLEDMGERPSVNHTIDRIDNTKGYYKSNCRWATKSQQCRNMSNNRVLEYDGRRQCLVDWAKEKGLTRHCIESRLKRGWSIDEALETASGKKRIKADKYKW